MAGGTSKETSIDISVYAILFNLTVFVSFVSCSFNNSKPKADSKIAIAGGSPVDASDVIAKATVALVKLDKAATLSDGQFCTGTVLSESWILSAAHCVTDEDVTNIGVVFVPRDGINGYGSENLRKVERILYRADNRLLEVCGDGEENKGNDGECGARIEPKTPTHDIALLHLSAPAPMSTVFARIPGLFDPLPTGLDVVAAGYGMQSDTDAGDSSLRKVTTISIANEWSFSWEFITLNMRAEGACPGDSGGPLFTLNDDHLTVFGAVSRGPDGCGKEGVAVVYSDVRKHAEWINCQMKTESQNSSAPVCDSLAQLTKTLK